MQVTFANICMVFISMEPSPLTKQIDEWFGYLVAGLRSFPLDFPGTAFHRARRCRRNLNAVFREELHARKKKAMATKAEDDDVMGGFMRMEDEQGKKLSDDEVVDNIVSLVVAGYESTSSAIMWATYHLAKSPEALVKLRVR
jgi:ent-kaurenoic acid hydroxylase